jgi:hypothetical protein
MIGYEPMKLLKTIAVVLGLTITIPAAIIAGWQYKFYTKPVVEYSKKRNFR